MEPELSVLIERYKSAPNSDIHRSIFAKFRDSEVGVFATGAPAGAQGRIPATAEKPLAIAASKHPNGLKPLLAFADPAIFIQRFGPRFNAGIRGDVMITMVCQNPSCDGILINSALSETSMLLSRNEILRFAQGKSPRASLLGWLKTAVLSKPK